MQLIGTADFSNVAFHNQNVYMKQIKLYFAHIPNTWVLLQLPTKSNDNDVEYNNIAESCNMLNKNDFVLYSVPQVLVNPEIAAMA